MCEALLVFPEGWGGGGGGGTGLGKNPFCWGGMDIFWNYTLAPKSLACMAGRRMGGKGPKGARKYWEGRRGGKRNGLQGRYCFLCFFRPPDERKNPDWSDFKNYLIRRSDWSTTCHSRSTRTQLAPTNFAAKKAA